MEKHKVSELEGALPDAAVALAEGRLLTGDEPRWPKGDYKKLRASFGGRHIVRWYVREGHDRNGAETQEVGGWEPITNWGSPSTDWNLGGPIIERELITIDVSTYVPSTPIWQAYIGARLTYDGLEGDHEATGPTPLIAAMRVYVASKLGDEIELP